MEIQSGSMARNGKAGTTVAPVAQPTCPACGSPDLRHEADDRHQCRRCLWRCRIGSNGKAIDWLNIGNASRAKNQPRKMSGVGASRVVILCEPSRTRRFEHHSDHPT